MEREKNFKKQKNIIILTCIVLATLVVYLFSFNFNTKAKEVLKDSVIETIISPEEISDEIVKEEKQVELELKAENNSTRTETVPRETINVSNEPKYRHDIASQYEAQINAYRVENGLSALPITSEAKSVANTRAMQLVSDYSHNNSVYAFGENIGNGTAGEDFVAAWKNSPSHNATMLREQSIAMAVSVVEYNGRWYAISVFKIDYSMFE